MAFEMENRTVLVTGSTDGIGKQTALELAAMGASVLIHGRDPARGGKVVRDIQRATGSRRLELYIADLASLEQVRGLAEELWRKHDRLDVLINNAGVYEKERRLTEDGFERTFAINYLAPFALTLRLMPLIRRSAPSRIVNVSSMAHASQIDFENLRGERNYEPYQAYALSKLGTILFTYELAERLKGTGVTVNCLHPGVIGTKLLRAGFGGDGSPVAEGARTSVLLASAPDMAGVSGAFFVDMQPARSSAVSYDAKMRKKLWELSEEMTGVPFTPPAL